MLFTPAYGAPVPRVAGAAEVVLDSFPAAVPNADLTATVTAVGTGGGETIPPLGAVLMATGSAAAKLQAEAPVGTPLTTRLILQPAWDGVVAALGGGPVLVQGREAGLSLARGLHERPGRVTRRRAPASASSPTAGSSWSPSTGASPGTAPA